MKQITHAELKDIIKTYYKNKLALLTYGRFGIGKSQVVRQTAEELAKERGREFVDWNKTTHEEKEKMFKNPENYFVLIDIRLSEWGAEDIKGLPMFMDNKKSIDFKVPMWALFTELKESDGILFFDELANAVPLTQTACFKIFLDRIIDDSYISENWLIMGASNVSEDRSYTYDIAPPLRDRAGEYELGVPTIESWTDWASRKGIDSRVISFLNFKPSNLHKVDFKSNQKYTSPRGWERMSKLINGVTSWDNLELLSGGAISEGVSSEFLAFCKIQNKLNLDELIKNPKKIKEIEDISIKYFLVGAIAEKYKDNLVDFDSVMDISKVLDEVGNAEFIALLWRLAINYTSESGKFSKDIHKCRAEDTTFINKYARAYIL